MSDHDALMSVLIALRAQLEEYIDEYDPPRGQAALEHLGNLMVLASKFPGEEES